MNYIVTGAGGYVGFAVVNELLARGIVPRCLVNSGKTKKQLEALGASVFSGDITRIETLHDIFNVEGEIGVIHAAALISVGRKMTDWLYTVNVLGTKNIIEKCMEKSAALSYIGSIEAAEHTEGVMLRPAYNPDAVKGGYAKSKAMAAELVLDAAKRGLRGCILLPCAVFGPYDYRKGPVSQYFPLYLKHRYLPFIKGGYEIVDNRDIAFAAVEALAKGKPGESYILSNKWCEMKDILNLMRQQKGMPKIKVLLPTWLVKTAAAVSEPFVRLMRKEPVFTAFTISCINRRKTYSYKLAADDLGYSPCPIEQTAKDMLRFYEDEGWI